MRTHFDNVGFNVPTRDHLTALIHRTANEGVPVESPNGRYFRWAPGAGIELWAGVDHHRDLAAFNPHLAGRGRLRVRVEALERDRQAPLTGSVRGRSIEDEPHPIVVDAPDFDFLTERDVGTVGTFQVAAFGHEVHVFDDLAAFRAANTRLAVPSFIPSGPLGDEGGEPRAEATLVGVVEDAELRENPSTGARFHWALVRTVGGTVDLVADPEVLSGPPGPDAVVYGEFWLSARLVPEDDARPIQSESD